MAAPIMRTLRRRGIRTGPRSSTLDFVSLAGGGAIIARFHAPDQWQDPSCAAPPPADRRVRDGPFPAWERGRLAFPGTACTASRSRIHPSRGWCRNKYEFFPNLDASRPSSCRENSPAAPRARPRAGAEDESRPGSNAWDRGESCVGRGRGAGGNGCPRSVAGPSGAGRKNNVDTLTSSGYDTAHSAVTQPKLSQQALHRHPGSTAASGSGTTVRRRAVFVRVVDKRLIRPLPAGFRWGASARCQDCSA
jgi:hypothetical protein